jgi:hypothetical protein
MMVVMMDSAAARPHMRQTKETASPNQQPIAQTNNAALHNNRVRTSHMAAGRTLPNRYHRLFHQPRHLPALFSARRMSRLLTRMSLANARNSVESDALACGPSAGDGTNAWCHAVERSRSHGGVKACRQAGTRYFT